MKTFLVNYSVEYDYFNWIEGKWKTGHDDKTQQFKCSENDIQAVAEKKETDDWFGDKFKKENRGIRVKIQSYSEI